VAARVDEQTHPYPVISFSASELRIAMIPPKLVLFNRPLLPLILTTLILAATQALFVNSLVYAQGGDPAPPPDVGLGQPTIPPQNIFQPPPPALMRPPDLLNRTEFANDIWQPQLKTRFRGPLTLRLGLRYEDFGTTGFSTQPVTNLPNIFSAPPTFSPDAPAMQFHRQLSLLPLNTIIQAVMDDSLNSRTAAVGDSFTSTVIKPTFVGSYEVIPVGTKLIGRVSFVKRAGLKSRAGVLGVDFTSLQLPDGLTHPINGSLTDVSGSINSGGTLFSRSANKPNAGFIDGRAPHGALIGAIAGGGKGAVIGAGIGGSFGNPGMFFKRRQEAEVKPGTAFGVVLNETNSRAVFFPRSMSLPVSSAETVRHIRYAQLSASFLLSKPTKITAPKSSPKSSSKPSPKSSPKPSPQPTLPRGKKPDRTGEELANQNANQAAQVNANTSAGQQSAVNQSSENKRELVAGKIAFKIPRDMKVEVSETIEIRITQNATDEELSVSIPGRGETQIRNIKVGPVMAVYLKPHDEKAFDIRLTNRVKDVQRLEGKKYIYWSYSVIPLKSGPQRLSIIAVAVATTEGQNEQEEEFEVFNEEIQVQVNPINFLKENWQFFAGGICTIFSGLVGFMLGKFLPEKKRASTRRPPRRRKPKTPQPAAPEES
jgi:hypothetical protein